MLIKNYHEEFSTLGDKVSYVFISRYSVYLKFHSMIKEHLGRQMNFYGCMFCNHVSYVHIRDNCLQQQKPYPNS